MMDVDESTSSQKERDSTGAPARCTVSDASTTDTIEALLARVENLEKAIIETTAAPQNPMNENDEPRSTLPLTIHDNRAKSGLYDTFELPESTFTLLITQPFLSIQFLTGLLACALALFCLILVLIDEMDKGTDDNPFGLPAGVTTPTRIAQYLGKKKDVDVLLLASYLMSTKSKCQSLHMCFTGILIGKLLIPC